MLGTCPQIFGAIGFLGLQLRGPEERPINVIDPNTSMRIVPRPRTTAMLAANGPARVPPLTVPMEYTRSRDPTRRREPQPNRSSRRVRIAADRPQLELRTGEASRHSRSPAPQHATNQ